MPKRRASSRPRSTRSSRRKGQSRVRQLAFALARRLLVLARPNSPSELLALILVLLSLGTAAALAVGALRGHQPGLGAFWCVVLLMLALSARLSPWWRAELTTMTRERARHYTGSSLLVFVALSLSWHLLAVNLGLGSAYLLLGPFSQPPGALGVLVVIAMIALALVLNAPVDRWLERSRQVSRQLSVRLLRALSAPNRPRVVEEIDVASLPLEEGVEDEETPTVKETIPVRPRRYPVEPSAPEPNLLPITNGPALPPIDIFNPAPKAKAAPIDLEQNAKRIQDTLASFNVSARVVGHHSGPVVTQFDVEPDRGVKVRRITELQNDLALALAAPTIRIQAPVPGRPVVGIEIPNSAASMVALRELLETEAYRSLKSPLKVALGKDVAGNTAIIDLAKMPHLLIAGATGSGKSVCVNGIISCLLYQNTPDQVRLVMIDPKMVELTVYNGVPHLFSPVVTQMDKVVGVLQWALREMERRYQLFADNAVRNILRYNEKLGEDGKKLPYIVLVVDELADLMMVAPEDVEDAICRLAQLARAAGIHLVIATQRPSVDVITGLIKANFPARIAFAMTSQVDSRTILDRSGAEKLLGRGDMLYQPPDGPAPVRLQGAFLSDQEIERLVEFWQRSPLQAGVPHVSEQEFAAAEKAASEQHDELLEEAIRVVREHQHASVSLLQRRLRIGYSRAARLMDQLEDSQVVGPADGSKQRPVLRDGESFDS